MIDLNKYRSIPFEYRSHNRISNIITDIDEYNEIVDLCHSLTNYQYTLCKNRKIHESKIIRDGWFFDNIDSTNTFSICLIYNCRLYKWVFHPGKDEEETKGVTGLDALKYIKVHCWEDIRKYAVYNTEDMKAVKDTIEKPLIRLNNTSIIKWGSWIEEDAYILRNVHHIDIHSAWPAALLQSHPELKQLRACYEELYKTRKVNEANKFMLNASIGAMQSYKIFPGFPALARDAINGNNKYMLELTKRLKVAGFQVIGYNTDGIFYYDWDNPNRLYHDENEGDEMGQWRHDHHFDQIRFKSAGAYEYIENGVYHAVVRGIPREISKNFVWGDIFKHHPKVYSRSDDGHVTERDMTEYEYEELLDER